MIDVDVLIVGAGPVGLMLANQLGLRGVRVLQIERNPSTVHEPRAIGYDDETGRAMQSVGLAEAFGEHIVEDLPFALLDRQGRPLVQIQVAERPYGHSWIGTLYQPALEAMLARNLARFPSVDLRFQHALSEFEQDDAGVTATVENGGRRFGVRARFLVGCDGGSSGVRRRLGLRFTGSTFAQRWLVIDCANDPYGRQEMTFLSDPTRPTVTLPAPGGRRRWEFLLHRGETAEAMNQPEAIARLLAPHHDPAEAELERSTVYTFHARAAERFRRGRVLLAGDAAHVMPPFAGQGMNSGIRDAVNLGWKLALVVSGEASDALLDSYDRERRGHVAAMTRLARFMGWLLMPTTTPHRLLRDAVLGAMRALPRTRRLLDSGELRPKPHLGRRALVVGRGGAVGTMLPQVDVLDEDGVSKPLDAVLGTDFALVGVDVDPLRRDDGWGALAGRLGARAVCIHTAGDGPLAATGRTRHVVDRTGTFAAFADRDLLVRPDRFVMAEVPLGDRDAVARAVLGQLRLGDPSSTPQRSERAS